MKREKEGWTGGKVEYSKALSESWEVNEAYSVETIYQYMLWHLIPLMY